MYLYNIIKIEDKLTMNLNYQALLIFILTLVDVCGEAGFCESPQYLERGRRGVVQCQFPESFYSVLWYNTTEYLNNDPIAYVQSTPNEEKIEEVSNEYNISPNGSLIINKVSLQHDRNFTAVVLKSPRDEYEPYNIHVIVTVRPHQMRPFIEGCEGNEQLCFKPMNYSSRLTCSVTDVRPSVDLNWYMKTLSTDYLLVSNKTMTLENHLYTTTVETTYTNNTHTNVVYVCKCVSEPLLMRTAYSLALIQNDSNTYIGNIEPIIVNAEQYSSTKLPCSNQAVLYLLWKKIRPFKILEDLIHIVSVGNSSFANIYSHNYHLTHQRSLRIASVNVKDEGVYQCSFGDGILEHVKKFYLQVYVMPDPENPIVEGCPDVGYCTLFLPKSGKIKCSLKGIRPKVELRWETVDSEKQYVIDFFVVSHDIEENGLKYDVHLTSNFSIKESFTGWIAIRCIVMDFVDSPFNRPISRNLQLVQLTGPALTNRGEDTVNKNNDIEHKNHKIDPLITFIIVICVLAVPVIASIIVYGVKKCRHSQHQTDEEMDLLDPQQPTPEKIETFKNELKTKYSNTWEKVFPLPYDRTVQYTINDIFIEGEIERLEKVVYKEGGNFNTWQKLKTRNEFLGTLWQRQAQIVLEGEPGFGKTTLGYQFAYDWTIGNESSPLKDVDIYILLRLRYLKGASSIPSAIKRFLLPGSSILTVEDIRNILYHSNSVIIFLDGFNRFSYDKESKINFMREIYTNNICQVCQVIVTTKPFCLPDEHTTDMSRMRLTGFGEESWREYLERAVLPNDKVGVQRILKIIHDNPLLRDLCQVPLFFVMFSHITKRDGNFSSDFSTVTSFFEAVISCFDGNINSNTKVNNHSALSSVCFNGLLKEETGLTWRKDDIRHKLGQTLYNEYLRVGLIVEKEFCIYPGRRTAAGLKYETKVRFFHDVFCEWYAAREMSKVFKSISANRCKKYFEKINPLDHQYVYRFACAMDPKAASNIINYMQRMKDGEKFAILCMVEQPGNFKDVEETIATICSSPVIINTHDSIFLQRSTVQVLEFASDKQINIECVWLARTYSTFDDDKRCLEMSSGVLLPILKTLRQIVVHDSKRNLSKDDLLGFLRYQCMCPSLKDLRFQACLLPFLHREDLQHITGLLDEKAIDIQWEIPVHERSWHTLDIESGAWRHKDETMSKEKYNQVVQSFNASLRTGNGINDLEDDPGACASTSD